MRATLKQLLPDAVAKAYAVPCFNVFGFEDAVSVVQAAEAEQAPVILATNKEMVEFMGTAQLAGMLGRLADEACVPVCVHLDHCYDVSLACQAIDDGYTSVMYDGSQLTLEENVGNTRQVVAHAAKHDVSVEGEIGSVPYSEGREHIKRVLTDADAADAFARDSGVDAVAISVGNVHRLTSVSTTVDFKRLAAIRERVSQPLVIHGSSGISDADQQQLAAAGVAKFNIGTSLRMRFGQALRDTLTADPGLFDRLSIFARVMPAVEAVARHHLKTLGASGQAPQLGPGLQSGWRSTPSSSNDSKRSTS